MEGNYYAWRTLVDCQNLESHWWPEAMLTAATVRGIFADGANDCVKRSGRKKMTQDPIPDEIRRFILTSISSVPFLEAMLLLRSNPNVGWNAKNLAQRLYVVEKRAEDLLSELQNAGFAVVRNPTAALYQFEPSSDELRAMCDRLADAYASNIIAVTNLVHSNVGRQAQQFADAFKWRKD
jgi:hypothetical protein